METVLIVVAFLLLVAGLLGSVLPVLPGPPLGFVGLLLLQWSGRGGFGPAFLWTWAAITVAVTVVDYFLPAWMTKRFGGSRLAVVGSVVGFVVGIVFFAPLGILLGPFLGALIGELIHGRIRAGRNRGYGMEGESPASGFEGMMKALKVALGSFLAFILGTGAKLVAGLFMLFYAIRAVFL